MGNIGPVRMHYDVLPIPAFVVQDADRWTLDTSVPPRIAPVDVGDVDLPHLDLPHLDTAHLDLFEADLAQTS
ncbi:MAG: hypothetical protein ABI345_00125 [Jatrophihabitans sp.]